MAEAAAVLLCSWQLGQLCQAGPCHLRCWVIRGWSCCRQLGPLISASTLEQLLMLTSRQRQTLKTAHGPSAYLLRTSGSRPDFCRSAGGFRSASSKACRVGRSMRAGHHRHHHHSRPSSSRHKQHVYRQCSVQTYAVARLAGCSHLAHSGASMHTSGSPACSPGRCLTA